MTKKINLFIIYFLILIEFLLLFNSKIIVKNVILSSKMFIMTVFPSLFPSMIVGNLLVKNNISIIIPKFIKNLFKKLFNYSEYMASIFIISIITGTPSNALYIEEYLNKGLINNEEASSLMCSTHFINPLFVVSLVGVNIFNSIKVGFIILFLILIDNLIKAYITRPKNKSKNKNYINLNDETFINKLFSTIKTSINSVLMILSVVILFNILTTLIQHIFSLNDITSTLINGILEMTGGITKISCLNINNILKFIFSFYILNFGGICIHMQALSMIKSKKIRYFKYLIFRLF